MNELQERPVAVKNRDIPLLSRVLSTMQMIAQTERRQDYQRLRMQRITQYLGGMPGGSRTPKGLDEAFAILSEIDSEYELQCRAWARELRKAEGILNGIESRMMRAFVTMKYVMDIPDEKIRRDLNMSRRKFEAARQAVEEAQSMEQVKWSEGYAVETGLY